MKKLIFILIFIYAPMLSFAKKIIDRNVDDFTAVESVSTSTVNLNISTGCNLIKVGGEFILSVAARVAGMYEVADMGELNI